MTVSIARTLKRMLLGVLSLLAGVTITGCPLGGPAYGSPPPPVRISGKVSQNDGTPIQGIRISTFVPPPNPIIPDAVAFSLADGQYKYTNGAYKAGGELIVTATDIDGAENGGDFASASHTVVIPSSIGDGYDLTVDFTLDPKP